MTETLIKARTPNLWFVYIDGFKAGTIGYDSCNDEYYFTYEGEVSLHYSTMHAAEIAIVALHKATTRENKQNTNH